ncbi:MAG TPA: arginine decarboxylase, partial [Coleofasciculaceae cyanobacterium]
MTQNMGVELTPTIGNPLHEGSANVDETQHQVSRDAQLESNQHSWQTPPSSWTIEDSEKLYRIQGWGEPYFSINAAGHITVSPKGDRGG